MALGSIVVFTLGNEGSPDIFPYADKVVAAEGRYGKLGALNHESVAVHWAEVLKHPAFHRITLPGRLLQALSTGQRTALTEEGGTAILIACYPVKPKKTLGSGGIHPTLSAHFKSGEFHFTAN